MGKLLGPLRSAGVPHSQWLNLLLQVYWPAVLFLNLHHAFPRCGRYLAAASILLNGARKHQQHGTCSLFSLLHDMSCMDPARNLSRRPNLLSSSFLLVAPP